MWKLARASFIPVWHYDFIPSLHEGTLHVVRRNRDTILDWMPKTTHAPPVPDSRGSDFHARAKSCTAFTCHRNEFRIGMKVSLRYNDRSELAPVWLTPLWDSVLVSCEQIQSHKRKPEWTRTGMKVAPGTCKHLLTSFKSTANLVSTGCGLKTVVSL